MKNSRLLLSIMLSVLLFSCSKAPQSENQPLELSYYWPVFGMWSDNATSIRIISGNEGYHLVFPKYVSILEKNTESAVLKEKLKVPYPKYLDSLFSLSIDESNNIVIRCKTHDSYLGGLFMVKDASGAKRIFNVSYFPLANQPHGGNLENKEPTYPGKDYWVNY